MPPETNLKRMFRAISGVSTGVVGVLPFVGPAGFLGVVRAWLPAPLFLVLVSGFFGA
jgi:uncharacterized membrane protein